MSSAKRKFKKLMYLAILLLILVLIVVYVSSVAYPLALNIAEAKTRAKTLDAINTASERIRKLSVFYDSFYNFERNNDGEIVLITANTSAINQMYIMCQSEIQKELAGLKDEKISIPTGAFSGLSIVADKGAAIDINVMPVGTAEASWNSYFFNEGINQTIHRVVLRIITKINILVPVKAATVTVTTDILISEDIIIGRVPDSYITGISEDNIFDLLP